MTSLPVLDSHAPPVRVMALHALAYCPRLFYLEEVEEIRVADERVFAGRSGRANPDCLPRRDCVERRIGRNGNA